MDLDWSKDTHTRPLGEDHVVSQVINDSDADVQHPSRSERSQDASCCLSEELCAEKRNSSLEA